MTDEGLPFHPQRPLLRRPVRIDPTGQAGPTRQQARGPAYRRTSHGWYVSADADGELPEQRIVEAAMVLPAYGGVTGWAALRWGGGVWFDGTTEAGRARAPVTLATSFRDVRNQPGIAVSQERLRPDELDLEDGLRRTIHVRSVCFEMRYAEGLRAAVRVLDLAAYSDLVSIAEVRVFADGLNGWTGIPQCRAAIELADENCWSPREVQLRLIWQLGADLPPPLCNRPVFDRGGQLLGTPDLLDVQAGVVGEYDGALHLEGARRRRDREREDAFRRVGLEYFTMMAGDREVTVIDRMLAARRRARFEAESRRAWTVEPPAWWVPTHTVALRRELSPWLRSQWLRHRLRTG